MKITSATAALLALVASMPFGAGAEVPPTAADLRLMVGAPPPAARRVSRANFTAAPFNRWSLQHARELLPTRPVPCAAKPSPLPEAAVDLDGIEVKFGNEERETLPKWLKRAYTDGFIVLHDGKVVYERYFNDQTPDTRHLMFSVTKSFTGTLALMLIEQGKINPKRQVSRYVDELTGTAFGDATVQQLLDMTNSIDFDETYTDPESDVSRFAAAFGWGTTPDKSGGSIYTLLQTLTAHDPHYAQGQAFHYVTADSEVLGWIIRRVTQRKLADYLADSIWKKLGAAADGYYVLDSEGTEMAGGGLNITLRDAARFGQMILDDGRFNGRQIVPAKVAERIKQPGNHAVFGTFYEKDPWYQQIGWAYHDQWWTFNNAHKAVAALGVYGQYIYIDPVARVVIVKQTSDPDAEGVTNDVEGPAVMNTIAEYLQQHPPKAGIGATEAGRQEPKR